MRIVIDTETTGLNPLRDEILQLAIIDADTGATLYNQYHKPQRVEEWAEAEAVNHITPEYVEDCEPITSPLCASKIREILGQADEIIGYNTGFDLAMLAAAGYEVAVNMVQITDVMKMFAPIYGERSEKHHGYKWQKLTTCAAVLGYDWGDYPAHDALNDCQATRYCWKKIIDDCKKESDEMIQRMMRVAAILIGTASRVQREAADPSLIFPTQRALFGRLFMLQNALEAVRDGNTESL